MEETKKEGDEKSKEKEGKEEGRGIRNTVKKKKAVEK